MDIKRKIKKYELKDESNLAVRNAKLAKIGAISIFEIALEVLATALQYCIRIAILLTHIEITGAE